ncbi:family 16 glycosylhydrolase [Pontibacter sp. G13]|uniref:family 16 glycosylhydrolase n=1 Tax=Pontibacter sp. G13 TaxID=3074898 RepID=UPI00288937BB|nr:family 16 glycosylhydrolase [Pontibacter sp. G13]WNJ20572.1 family 16 glycosylhydrolase [Pontibacter sp. G13]
MTTNNRLTIFAFGFGAALMLGLGFGCTPEEPPVDETPQVFPDSDPDNLGNWVYKTRFSDEFEDAVLDEEKWHIQGKDGQYESNFIGRAPAQFSTDNVRIEDGKLMIETRWEPDFPFSTKVDYYANGTSYQFENMTTAAVIGKNLFRYGYMEIKCKAADASITSSFWMTGQNTELDVFEFVGKPKQSQKAFLEKEYKFSIHDWAPGMGGPTVWTDKYELPWRVADDFHTYGCEWSAEGLKFYADGELIREATAEQIEAEATDDAAEEAWILHNPLKIWVDSEAFPWHGIPEEGDLPVDFEIEYIRVWQKE